MYHDPGKATKASERFLAELTDAAYRVALRHGFKGSFIDVELDLWKTLRLVLAEDTKFQELYRQSDAGPERDKEDEASTVLAHRWLNPEDLTCTA
jgi:hypothetical protein